MFKVYDRSGVVPLVRSLDGIEYVCRSPWVLLLYDTIIYSQVSRPLAFNLLFGLWQLQCSLYLPGIGLGLLHIQFTAGVCSRFASTVPGLTLPDKILTHS